MRGEEGRDDAERDNHRSHITFLSWSNIKGEGGGINCQISEMSKGSEGHK